MGTRRCQHTLYLFLGLSEPSCSLSTNYAHFSSLLIILTDTDAEDFHEGGQTW